MSLTEDEAEKKPVKGTNRRNADETTVAALAIIDADEVERHKKTARLKALRLEQQQSEVKTAKKAATKARKTKATAAT